MAFKRVLIRGLVLVVLMAAYIVSAGSIYQFKDTITDNPLAPLPEVDAIVCLAGGKGRIGEAAELWLRYYQQNETNPPMLYVSGMGPKASYSTLENQVKPEILTVLKPEWVLIENESSNTIENAKWAAKNADQYKWKSIALVTSTYHMKRARMIFERALRDLGMRIETYSAGPDPNTQKFWMTNQKTVWVTLEEYSKYIFYLLTI